MNNPFKRLLIALSIAALGALAASLPAQAQTMPVLRENIMVNSPIVTVGDMFENAGALAETGLFRAPAPGTTGRVDIDIIRTAAIGAGLDEFQNPGFASVSVGRTGIMVTRNMLAQAIAADLNAQGVLAPDVVVETLLDTPLANIFAATGPNPLSLQNLRFIPGSNRFSARVVIAGQSRPVDLSGRLDFSISRPILVRALPAGTILQPSDFQMRDVDLQFAQSQGVPSLEQLVGKQLLRQFREGSALRFNDVTEPVLIARNQAVTLYLKSGALTLTVKGQALGDASQGQTVSVLNLLSNRVVQGIAISPGTVEIQSVTTRVAAL